MDDGSSNEFVTDILTRPEFRAMMAVSMYLAVGTIPIRVFLLVLEAAIDLFCMNDQPIQGCLHEDAASLFYHKDTQSLGF